MKLITETFDDYHVIQEATERGEKKMYIEGIFMQGNLKNRNGRVYPISVLDKEVQRYTKSYVNENRAFGELGHPSGPVINADRICMMIESLRKDGNDYIGKAKILSTPMGKIVESLINDGAKLGVSSRGMGTIRENKGIMEVQDDFYLSAVDVVSDPSAPGALVRGIMENVDWVFDEKLGWKAVECAESYREELKKEKKKLTEARMLSIFNDFIKKL
jgi:hypothetical protein